MDALFDWRKNFCHAVRTSDLVHTIKYVKRTNSGEFFEHHLTKCKVPADRGYLV